MRLEARPGQGLDHHLEGVAEYSRRIVEQKELSFEGNPKDDIVRIAHILGASHDFGKATGYFQRYIDEEAPTPDEKYRRHSSISAFYAYHVLKQEGFDDIVAVIGWFVVQKHHGNLSNLLDSSGEIDRKTREGHRRLLKSQAESIREKSQDEVERIYSYLGLSHVETFLDKVDSGEIFDEIERDRLLIEPEGIDVSTYYLTLFLYSVLLDSDKTHSAGVRFEDWVSVGEVGGIDGESVRKYKTERLSVDTRLDERRDEAFEQVSKEIDAEEGRYSLTLPTGGGKTLNALNAAFRLRETAEFDRKPRIIYSLPFLSIIDQNHEVLSKVLNNAGIEPSPDILLRHDHTSSGFAEGEGERLNELSNPNRALLMTEGWNSEIVTTTFVQFFESLVTNRNSNARRFHKMVNSVILLDEIQSVPVKYWGAIKEGLTTLTQEFNSYVILLTATNPLIFEPGDEITELVENHEGYFREFDRVTYEFEGETTLDELGQDVVKRTGSEPVRDVMVVMNTVASSKELYEQVSGQVERETVYLSTNILPKHRQERIEHIKESDKPLLIVTTQLVEAGVDIDIDIVYRDFAPLDSIVQTAGRCNREDRGEKGEVHVVRLKTDDGPRDYYYQYVYDSTLLGATEDVVSEYDDTVTESEFSLRAVESYFRKVNEFKDRDAEGILEAMERLNCDEVDVSLIEQTYETVSVFIEWDKEASEAYEKMEEVYEEYEGYERKGALLGVKSEFYSNVLSVKVRGNEDELEYLPDSSFSDNVLLVQRGETNKWYNEKTGFEIPEDTVSSRII